LTDLVTGLGGRKVGPEEFLAAVLQTIGQPRGVDPDGLIRSRTWPRSPHSATKARPSGSVARATRPSVITTPTAPPYPVTECPMLLPLTTARRSPASFIGSSDETPGCSPCRMSRRRSTWHRDAGAVVAVSGIEDPARRARAARARGDPRRGAGGAAARGGGLRGGRRLRGRVAAVTRESDKRSDPPVGAPAIVDGRVWVRPSLELASPSRRGERRTPAGSQSSSRPPHRTPGPLRAARLSRADRRGSRWAAPRAAHAVPAPRP
jgi:hypothetical protein